MARKPDSRRSWSGWLIVTLAVGSAVYPASAKTIQLTTYADPIASLNRETEITIHLDNSGDEAAQTVQLSALLPPGFSMNPVLVGPLKPGTPTQVKSRIRYEGQETGSFAGALLTQYADANGYPFSAVSPLVVWRGTPPAASVLVTGKPAVLKQGSKVTLRFEIVSRELTPIDASCRLLLPRELTTKTSADPSIRLEPGGQAKLSFSISDLGALPGSSYAVLLAVNYAQPGRHCAVFGPIIVRVDPPQSRYLMGICVLFGALLFWFFFKRRSPAVR